jgi:hypothetical protein
MVRLGWGKVSPVVVLFVTENACLSFGEAEKAAFLGVRGPGYLGQRGAPGHLLKKRKRNKLMVSCGFM